MRVLSKTISAVFHPLLMPTFGVILAMCYSYLWVLPPKMKLAVVFIVFSITCFLPASIILLMIRFNMVKNAELTDRKERAIPYLINISSIIICSFLLYKIHMPLWIIYVFLSVCAALLIALCVNFYWKISAHALGIGAMLGGVMTFAKISFSNFYPAFMLLFIIAGTVGTSRVYLGRHTPMQVYAGFLLGAICTFSVSFLKHNIFLNV